MAESRIILSQPFLALEKFVKMPKDAINFQNIIVLLNTTLLLLFVSIFFESENVLIEIHVLLLYIPPKGFKATGRGFHELK